MSLHGRIEKIEQKEKPKRTAFFTIHYGKANGRAWWRDDLTWENLSQPEFEQLAADLKSEGVEVLIVNIIGVHAKGQGVDGWGRAVKV